jgi:hypothetical protein
VCKFGTYHDVPGDQQGAVEGLDDLAVSQYLFVHKIFKPVPKIEAFVFWVYLAHAPGQAGEGIEGQTGTVLHGDPEGGVEDEDDEDGGACHELAQRERHDAGDDEQKHEDVLWWECGVSVFS